jgi:hypothetical protein
MPNTAALADDLRERARTLRRLAGTIDAADAAMLYRRAGVDTWIGPTPQHCVDDLLIWRNLLFQAADALRSGAYRLELRATQVGLGMPRADPPVGEL